MGAITIAIIVLVVAAVVGFALFLGLYHYQQRRRGVTPSSILPTSFKGVFGGSTERETGTRFAALDVDEAWDSHVDEEMGYDSVRLQSGTQKEGMTHEELDDRYEEIMGDGEATTTNPFDDPANNRKSAFKEGI